MKTKVRVLSGGMDFIPRISLPLWLVKFEFKNKIVSLMKRGARVILSRGEQLPLESHSSARRWGGGLF